jgi:hypothetical protein
MRHNALRSLLFGLLFAFAQSFAFAHEVTHDLSGEPELCATCTVGGTLKAALEGSPSLPIARPEVLLPGAVAALPGYTSSILPPEARAPPKHA